jgi:hypothetical protein
MKQKGTEWTDGKGKTVPTYAISPVLRAEEKFAHQIAARALAAEKALKETVALVIKAYDEVYELKTIEAKMKGNKGNFSGMTITSFDNTIEVKVTKPDVISFDNTFTDLVKQKFDEYFESLSAQSETALFMRDLINDLLYTSGGSLDNGKVLKLRKYRDRIQSNPKLLARAGKFVEAVDLFDKAIKTKPGGTGIYVSVTDENGKQRRVALKYTDI